MNEITQADDAKLGEVVDEILSNMARGESPNIEAYVGEYPELAGILRNALPALRTMVQSGGATPTDEMDSLPPDKMLGDFRIRRELGRGGMGIVYEAEQISLDRWIALKVLPFAAVVHHKGLQRFRIEVRAAAALDHPNIVSVYSVGEERGIHYYAMQLIRGNTLAEVIRELSRLRRQKTPLGGDSISQLVAGEDEPLTSARDEPTEQFCQQRTSSHSQSETTSPGIEAQVDTLASHAHQAGFYRSIAKLGVQAAAALQHAHEHGVLHRDIKPGNLMLDSESQLYVTDFGLAHIEADAGMTMTGDLIGTLRYTSPEQILGKRVLIDQRSDIYSLGATLYELLCLRPAYTGESRQELLKQIACDEPVKLRKMERAIPWELETIVHCAMEKTPEERYATAQELADDLQAFLEHRSLCAKPPTLRDRCVKWSRRHRPLVWSVAASMAFMLIGSVIALSVGYVLVAQQREIADRKSDTANAVVQFINQDLLGAADPLNEPDRDVKLRTVVDRAANEIDERFADQPLVAAAVRMTLGQTYRSLGEYASSREQFENALELYTRFLGADHADTLECQRHLANSYLDLGMDVDAEQLHRAVFESRLHTLGDMHPDSLQSMNDLAVLAQVCGRFSMAKRLMHHVLSARIEQLGELHPLTLASQHRYAQLLLDLDNAAQAETMLAENLAARERTLGSRHPDTLASQFSLVSLRLKINTSTFNHRELSNLLADLTNVLGAEHPRTLLCMQRLALAYMNQQMTAEATQLLTSAHAVAAQKLSNEHPIALQIDFARALNAAARGEIGEAEDQISNLLDRLLLVYGPEHPATRSAKSQLAKIYQALGWADEAERMLAGLVSYSESSSYIEDLVAYDRPLSYRANTRGKPLVRYRSRVVPNLLSGHDVCMEQGAKETNGLVGRALSFDGVGGRAMADDRPEFAFDTSLSIYGWIRVDSFPSRDQEKAIILMRADDRNGRDPYWLACLPSRTLQFGVSSSSEVASISAPISQSVWTHVVAKLDDLTGEMQLFIDGQEVASRTTDVRPLKELDSRSNPAIGIGNHGGVKTPHNFPFHGKIDELGLVGRPLSQQEIAESFMLGHSSINHPP